MKSASEYLDAIRKLRERALAENSLEAELCSAVVFLLQRELEREQTIQATPGMQQ